MEDPALPPELENQMVEFLLPVLATAIYNFSFLFDMDQFVLAEAVPGHLPGLVARTEQVVNNLLAHRKRSVAIKQPSSPHCTLVGAAGAVFKGTILSELQG